MTRYRNLLLMTAALAVMLACGASVCMADERGDLGYYTLVDEQEQVITMTGRELDGDRYIAGDTKSMKSSAPRGTQFPSTMLKRLNCPKSQRSC